MNRVPLAGGRSQQKGIATVTSVENIATLITIVFGLMLTDLFASVHRLIRHRRRVRWDWLPVLVAWYVLAIILKNWWDLDFSAGESTWGSGWVFLYYGHLLLLLYLLASAVLPDEVPDDGLDLRAYYFRTRRHFWGLLAAVNVLLLFYAVGRPLLTDVAMSRSAIVGNTAMIVLNGSLAWSGRVWYHSAIVILLVGLLVLEILSKFGGG